ncbi:MAG: ComEC/Rec2 family competence protein, partial [Phycisphaerales bacterium JB039]
VGRVRAGGAWRAASGRATLTVVEAEAPAWLRAGERVRITAWASRTAGPMNPGAVGAPARLPAVSLRAPRNELLQRMEAAGGLLPEARSAWLRWRADARRYLSAALGTDGAPDGPGAMLGAIALGQREFGSETEQAFQRVGLAHLMAISGLHLAILIGGAAIGLRLLGDLGRWEAIIVALVTITALLIIPARAPIVRAAIMALALLLARALGRRWDPLAVLAWTAALVLVWRPSELWSMGFQLSFGMVAALILLGPVTQRRLFGQKVIGGLERPPSGWRWGAGAAWVWSKGLVSVSALCWLIGLPAIVYHTGLVSPLAIAATVITLPLIALLLIASYALALLGLIVPPAAALAGGALRGLAELAHWVVMTIDQAPWASIALPQVTLAWTIGATGVAMHLIRSAHWRDGLSWMLVGAVCLWLGVEVRQGQQLRPEVALRIDTLSVADGTCHLVRSGGEAMLWDCGSMRPGIGRSEIQRAVRALGAWKVPVVVLTHANLDHYNALADVAPALGVQRVIVGEAFAGAAERAPRSGPGRLLERLRGRAIEIEVARAGDWLRLGESRLRFLSPAPGAQFRHANDTSLVGRIECAGGSLLLTGDIQREAIAALLSSGAPLRAEAMEVPHHGSPTDAALELVAQVSPRAIVQSSGRRLADAAQWDEVRRQRTWLQTPVDGAVWVELLRDGRVRAGTLRGRR